VVSDAFPSGLLPRPALPDFLLGLDTDPARRKAARQLKWLRAADAALPLIDWLKRAEAHGDPSQTVHTQNTINRLTGTTGSGPFAPRQVSRLDLHNRGPLSVYCVIDEGRFDPALLGQLLKDVGHAGFGRDASTGLGKFEVSGPVTIQWPDTGSRHALSLAPCAPVPADLDASACHYQPLTRFGRHGNLAALGGSPFKRPVLMLSTAAFLTFRRASPPPFHGCGLGGRHSPISDAIPGTVHQGYAPLVPLNAELRS
jgi:CRISPR-associated protein Csm4